MMKEESSAEDTDYHPLLVLQQRCLRYVTSLCIRNMTITLSSETDTDPLGSKRPLLYFTLHSSNRDTKEAVYKSEEVSYSPNPTWSSFSINSPKCSHLTAFTVRLWLGKEDNFMPALQWEIALETLSCVGNSLYSDKVAFHSNAIVFGMHRFYYGHSTSVTMSQPVSSLLKLDFTDIRTSYSLYALRRVASSKNALLQCTKKVVSLHEDIKKQSEEKSVASSMELELEDLLSKVAHLKALLRREQGLLRHEKKMINSIKIDMKQQEAESLSNREKLLRDRHVKDSRQDAHINVKVKASQLGSQLGTRRRDILSELSHIFPIAKVTNPITSKSQKKEKETKVYTICDVRLPQSESFNQKDDLHTSVALGYASQLLSMMSQFLLVPLRYPIVHKGSQSTIMDQVTDKLNDRERIFPLYMKGNKDRFLSEYGVFLLNKNIAQLRYYCGVGTADLRPTLANIRMLLEERLGAKSSVGHRSQPITINVGNTSSRLSSTSSVSSVTGKTAEIESMTLPPSFSLNPSSDQRNKLARTETHTSPYKVSQRMDNRNSDLLSLRGELFGSSESVKTRDKSPHEYRERSEGIRSDSALSDSIVQSTAYSNEASYRSNINDDSVESVLSSTSSARCTHLTGLEEIGQAKVGKKETKMQLASARAELLGRRSTQASQDPSRWSRKTSGTVSESLTKKRNELFSRRETKDHSDSNSSSLTGLERSKTDTLSSTDSDTKQEAGSNHSKPVSNLNENDPVKKLIDQENHPGDTPHANGDSSNDSLPSKNVCIADSSSHMDHLDQSDEEIDLC